MRRHATLAALLVPLALAGCGVSDTRYKAALDQVAQRAKEAEAEKARADALATRVAKLEERVLEAERARRAATAEAAAHQARAEARAAAAARLESELDAALAESHRVAARLAEATDAGGPWATRACSPLGAVLRSAGLCAVEAGPALVSDSAPAAAR